jgi:hypothetical protein
MAVVPIVSLLPVLPPQAAARARYDGTKTLTPVPRQGNWGCKGKLRVQSFVSPQSFIYKFLLSNRIEAITACARMRYSCLYAPAIWMSYLSEEAVQI